MSSIKLSPNPSGAGIFTVAAPNSASNYTLTLPTETGTVLTNAGPFTANASASAGAVTIDASNNVGIGTSSPNLSASNRALTVNAPNAGDYSAVELSSGGALRAYMNATNGAFYIASQSTNPMVFYTNGSERARIDSSGNLLVGTSSATTGETKLILSTNSGTTNWRVGPWATVATNFYISPNSATSGVYLNGTSATSWSALSDERYKEGLEPIESGLAKTCTLRAVTGYLKGDETRTKKTFLIAQEVQAVLPEAVDSSNPDRLGLSYTDTIPLLVAAIKELKAEVDALKAQLGAQP